MTTLQCLSHTEQMEAHRLEFLSWWSANVWVNMDPFETEAVALSKDLHWLEWKKKRGLK